MKSYATFGRTDSTSIAIIKKIGDSLKRHGWEYNDECPDLVVVVGGDGKLLRAIHKYLALNPDAKFIALNTGTLGFLTDYSPKETDLLILDVIQGNYSTETCNLLEARFFYDDGEEVIYGINELRIEHRFRTLDINIFVDDKPFETIVGNGVCISTPIGSTAYNRSIGGAIIDRDIEALQLTEVAGIYHRKQASLRNPLIVGPKRKITITCSSFRTAFVGVDNFLLKKMGIQKIEVQLSKKAVTLLHVKNFNLIDKIKEKYIISD